MPYLPDIIDEMPAGDHVTIIIYLRECKDIVEQFAEGLTRATRFFFKNKEESNGDE